MIYMIVTILLTITVLILAAMLLLYKRQMNEICRQLSFLKEHDTNMLITSNLQFGGFSKLAEHLNFFIDHQKQERIHYVNKEKAISDIYTNLSHDIRTPLTSLDGYFQLLEQGGSRQEEERYLAVIRSRIYCLKEMLEELFTFSKLENNEYELPLSKCCINRILKDTIFSYYDDWKRMGIEAHLDLTEQPLHLMGNEQALQRTIQNILKNGMDYGDRQFDIVLYEKQQNIILKIGNTVSSPDVIDISKVFERFYKSDISRNKTSTGLGLSIAKEFVQRMNGEIAARMIGNKFWIEICFPFLS